MALEQFLVQVQEINANGTALCQDSYGRTHLVPTRARRGKGALPAAGEFWIIDRTLGGDWSFAAVLDAELPAVEGEVDQDSATDMLISLLAQMGFVRDDAVRVPPGTVGGTNWEPWMNVSP